MIHLDRNHPSPIAHHPKGNLILADSNHADQHPILSWSAPARDDRAFYQDHQDQFLKDISSKPAIQTENPAIVKDAPSIPSSALGPVTPGDAEDPKLPGPSPSSPADAPSPIADSSSSLSPPPETATPAPADPDPVDGPAPEMTAEGADERPVETQGESSGEVDNEVDRASRQSTPLSELSSAPDLDEDSEMKAAEEVARPSSKDGTTGDASSHETKAAQKPAPVKAQSEASLSKPATSGEGAAPASSSLLANDPPAQSSTDQTPAISDGFHNLSNPAGPHAQHVSLPNDTSRPSSSQFLSSMQHPLPFSGHHASTSTLDPKVVAILELNMHLLSVCMAYQSQGVALAEPRIQQYSSRLQSNLTWLAAAADENQKGSRSVVGLPHLQPPPVLDFGPMERIQQIYSELPTIFANEISRKQNMGVSTNTPLLQLPLPNGKLKRDRPDEAALDPSNKRRDTGETKIPTPIIPPTPMTHQTLLPNLAPQITSPNSMHQLRADSSAAMRSPSMPPPSVPSALNSNATEAQLFAAHTRQVQMRQAMQQQQQHQQQQQQQPAESSRQMSPLQQQAMTMPNIAGPSSMSGMSQQNAAALAAIGPHARQHLQLLQNYPNHPMVQYLVQQVPGFTSLPLAQQLQKMHLAQTALQARNQQQQQNQRAAAQQASAAAAGFPQAGMSSFTSGGMASGQMPQGGSPTRVSPVSQQHSPIPGGQQLGGFPFTNHGPNQQMDVRTATAAAAAAGFTPQQQAAFASMTPQQRQLFMMQQQMMRSGNAPNQSMMNPQMMAAAQERMRQEQRMVQAGMSHLPGSPMMDGVGSFPALRSNPSVPGIARSARTPSDSAPSPVAQQRLPGQGQDDLQRAMLIQQAQRGMTPHLQNTSGFPQMNGGMLNQGWPQNNQQQSQMSHNLGSYGMSPPGSANPAHGGGGGFGMGGGGGLPGGLPSPAGSNLSHVWTQNAVNGQYPYVAASPSASQHHSDPGMTPRQASATPAPHMPQNSPGADMSEFELFNWGP
ncbi:hypothetical protein BKA93DRAFT_823990 [Sparassis latifolia]